MGMYTEIFFRAGIDPKIVPFLQKWDDGGFDWGLGDTEEIPNYGHEFFRCSRWTNLMGSNDSYFPMSYGPSVREWEYLKGNWSLSLHTCIKNYSSEYEKFFDWIMPYVNEPEGTFIGYTLYEEDNTPVLYHSDGVGYENIWRRKYYEKQT